MAFLILSSIQVGSYGMNREINFGIQGYLTNSEYNLTAFYFIYIVSFITYLIVFMMKRRTNFNYSILHFFCFMVLFFMMVFNHRNFLIIPISIICFIFFILNIFKTSETLNIKP